jgi:hypothetical protein
MDELEETEELEDEELIDELDDELEDIIVSDDDEEEPPSGGLSARAEFETSTKTAKRLVALAIPRNFFMKKRRGGDAQSLNDCSDRTT